MAGRMTTIDEGQPFSVIVDYAHSPDSFEQFFKDLRPVVKGKLIVLSVRPAAATKPSALFRANWPANTPTK